MYQYFYSTDVCILWSHVYCALCQRGSENQQLKKIWSLNPFLWGISDPFNEEFEVAAEKDPLS